MTTKTLDSHPLNSSRTKVLATVGPSTNSLELIQALITAGADGLRINMSHGTHESFAQQVDWIRQASELVGREVAIVADLQGPKIRLGDLVQPHEVAKGDTLKLAHTTDHDNGIIPLRFNLAEKVKSGDRLMIADGRVRTVVTSVDDGVISAEVLHGGWLQSRKGINVPDTNMGGRVVTKKDIKDMEFALEQGVDYIAQSFVQTADDISSLRKRIQKHNSDVKIIAKIETKIAVDNIESIIEQSDAVMVARGDLANETEPESVPIIQRRIIGLAQDYGKVSIVATQMLASMVDAPTPTRAEVSDVATAVIVGVDCVMLSDETASGDFPAESVRFMERIIGYTEANAPVKPLFLKEEDPTIGSSISAAAITLAHQVRAKVMVVETASGTTARSVASHRPNMPIIMVTHEQQVARQLSLVYGGRPFVRPKTEEAGEKITDWLRDKELLTSDDMVVIVSGKYPGQVGGTDTIKVRKIM